MKVQELSGVELAHAVAEAVGWIPVETRSTGILLAGPFTLLFKPHSSADDALEALKVMNGRGWVATWDQGNNEMSLDKDVGYKIISAKGNGQTFPEALSRAIVAAHESEKAK